MIQKLINKLINTVREFADLRPDNVYKLSNDSIHCQYIAGTCSDGSIGCIFGQAFKELGLDWGEYGDTHACYGTISALVQHFCGCGDHNILNWLDCVQVLQDMGHEWKNVVNEADLKYPLEVNDV